ncbi:hypothetical protein DPMN_026475 [Dreissena polymorpha]|uniref:Uncharacterized protein n=1 Tax=Dreissena polymorpha TaxID=45954 RepID=A0A9D4LV94_DREPO|nr:hypothetical protein DPMN_026475 [Dreissena polymorpha]
MVDHQLRRSHMGSYGIFLHQRCTAPYWKIFHIRRQVNAEWDCQWRHGLGTSDRPSVQVHNWTLFPQCEYGQSFRLVVS